MHEQPTASTDSPGASSQDDDGLSTAAIVAIAAGVGLVVLLPCALAIVGAGGWLMIGSPSGSNEKVVVKKTVESEAEEAASSSSESSESASASGESHREPKSVAFDEQFRHGQFSYRVHTVRRIDTIRSTANLVESPEGSTFIEVVMDVRSHLDDTRMYTPGDSKLRADDGTSFDHSKEARTALRVKASIEGDDDAPGYIGADIDPNSETTVASVFVVPTKYLDQNLTFAIPIQSGRDEAPEATMTIPAEAIETVSDK